MSGDNGLKEIEDGLYAVIRTPEQRKRVYIPTEERLNELLFPDRSTKSSLNGTNHEGKPGRGRKPHLNGERPASGMSIDLKTARKLVESGMIRVNRRVLRKGNAER
jgi:hypothetical protein